MKIESSEHIRESAKKSSIIIKNSVPSKKSPIKMKSTLSKKSLEKRASAGLTKLYSPAKGPSKHPSLAKHASGMSKQSQAKSIKSSISPYKSVIAPSAPLSKSIKAPSGL
jgi:hypothetical protein